MRTQVPFIDLLEQHRGIEKEIKTAVGRVFDSQRFILNDSVQELERVISKRVGCAHGIGVASGSDALYLSLWAMGVKSGDEVITTPFTFFASAGSISRLGAKPVFVDIDPRTFNLDPERLEAKITRRTKVIMPVHLFGLPCDMDPILKIARRKGLWVVEDAAQALGAKYRGQEAGGLGDAGCFSFYPTKNLGGAGDGGMIAVHSAKLAEKIRLLRDHGSPKKYFHDFVGINSRLDGIQAAVLLVKLKYMDRWNRQRQEHAAYYDRELKGLPVVTPYLPKGDSSIYHLYSILTPKRDALKDFLLSRGIGVGVYYPLPLHLQACYKGLGNRKGDFPVTEDTAKRILSLPMYPEISQKSKELVVSSIRDFFRKNG
ncbi:MAG TPA: DegT/DnrJ/EryC1/StrS family aminotransferase [Candidatus Omnitrophota bacterium]|nr:DegT/DnrJ/EryC1/StrS family aminotransferase [Candidatus Omnitrophota bacterium]